MKVNRESLAFFSTLASETRLQIIEQISEREMNLRELAEALGLSVAIISRHIKMLESAGVVRCENVPGSHGLQKVCSLSSRTMMLDFTSEPDEANFKAYQIPVGQYVDWSASPTCGLSTGTEIIGELDDERFFADPLHINAQMIWLSKGYLSYVLPNYMTGHQSISSIRFQMELCSEAPGYNEQWPSDIKFHVNDRYVGYWTCPGDFGERSGLLTPKWWLFGTQYGLLKTLTINEDGTFIDGSPISGINVHDLNFKYGRPIHFRIEASDDTENMGGFCLFGKGFGNYDQGIIVSIEYKNNR